MHQDLKLAKLAVNARVGIIIVCNKTDLLEDNNDAQALTQALQHTFNFISWAPVVLTSAKTGKNIHKIFDLILQINRNRSQKINQVKLDELRSKLVSKQPPPQKKSLGRKGTRAYKVRSAPKLVNLKQISNSPPHFEIVYRGVGMLPLNYLRYLHCTRNICYICFVNFAP